MYLVKYFDKYDVKNWDEIKAAKIDNYPWDKKNYKPRAEAKLFYTKEAIYVKFLATEKSIVVENFENNLPVYRDSCVEFFIAPSNNDKRYMNFETNAIGKLLLQIGENISDRETLVNEDYSIFNIRTSAKKDNLKDFDDFKPWTIEYKIPIEFIKKYFKDFKAEKGYKFKGNFYKCGDKTEVPHYGSWNPIIYHKPPFHRPEFFGEFILE